jgi:hypothetical protein
MKCAKFFLIFIVVCCVLIVQSGCNPEADLKLNFSPNQTHTYKAVSQSRKDYLFDQPNENKKTEKMSEVIVEMTYDQTVESVDEQGNANAKITIKGVKYYSRDKDGVDTDYDSSKKGSSPADLKKIIGMSYNIKITSDGKVIEVSGRKDIIDKITGRLAAKLVRSILSEEALKNIHSIKSLPDTDKSKLKLKDTWLRKGRSPKSALVVKSFDKEYLVKDIRETAGGTIADIQMRATPASAKSGEVIADYGSMGVFGNIFESNEDFSGHLKLNLNSGEVLSYEETFIGKYTAVQPPEDGSDDGMLRLELGYTEIHSIDAVK